MGAPATPSSDGAPPRALRADARRNREAILRAAAEAFDECGLEVGVAEIARRAGVGPATLFRRFPSKDDLIVAVLEDRLEAMNALADDCLAEPDPWRAFARLVEATSLAQARDRALVDGVAGHLLGTGRLAEIRASFVAAATELLERAQAAGAVRADVTAGDLSFLLIAGPQAARGCFGALGEPLHRRYLAVLLDGLRPHDGRLPGSPPRMEDVTAALDCRD
jgi:AcrR family transcriptional regulator